ncbi:MAG: hypothetical protein OEY48_00300 [Gammaproteobacteria bacterium]|nr:hypothetical protein [Gammaproteobacteria bacterium]MDH5591269.1 hypothetical protein [Gammaproteobacteria bacterium]
MKKWLFLIFSIAVLWKMLAGNDSVVLGPGIKVADPPVQEDLVHATPFNFKGYRLTPLAMFQLKGKVLSRKNYSFGRESELSPVDLALGWGDMSDETVLDKIDISQSGRWYRWQVQAFPIPRKAIETQSANMHLIPANELVEDTIDLVKQGQLVELNGYLIQAEADDGWHWKSSLTRNDTGAHACELVYVESIQVIH